MKVSDIKGDIGKRASYWVMDYINNLIFDEIKQVAPALKFRGGVQLWRMEDFKKLLSGRRVGFPTHGCASGEIPWCSWVMQTIHSVYSKEPITVDIHAIDVYDYEHIFNIEVDLVNEYDSGRYWNVSWSIQADKNLLLDKLESLFGKEVEKVKTATHKDIRGQELKIGDIVCYSTTYSNKIRLGTIDKFNDCSMVVDGSDVPYDSVLAVNNEIRYNGTKSCYEHC